MWNKFYLFIIIIFGTVQLWTQDSSFTFKDNDYVNIGSKTRVLSPQLYSAKNNYDK
jgi:hypothetical protein